MTQVFMLKWHTWPGEHSLAIGRNRPLLPSFLRWLRRHNTTGALRALHWLCLSQSGNDFLPGKTLPRVRFQLMYGGESEAPFKGGGFKGLKGFKRGGAKGA